MMSQCHNDAQTNSCMRKLISTQYQIDVGMLLCSLPKICEAMFVKLLASFVESFRKPFYRAKGDGNLCKSL